MYAVGVPVLCVLRGLPARKEQQKEKARTSFSKGERQRESKGKDKHSKEIYSPMLRTSRGGSRKANQIASEKQIASSKQSTKYVDERSKARRHRSNAPRLPEQSTTSSHHDYQSNARRLSCLLQASCERLFSCFVPPFRRSRRRRGAPATGLQCVRQPGDCGVMSP